ncbi:MAG: hypothetical protein MJ168_00065 [Clostridia bacterium]|nr:hypothetical protein [Clostridia bacterium]
MSTPVIKKTLNLHKYSVRVNDFVLNWKIVVPVTFSVAGLVLGALSGKGEGKLFLKVTDLFLSTLSSGASTPLSSFISSLLPPTVFAVVLFFLGLSAYGGFAVNFIPLCYSYLIGMISYFMYDHYTLKGLAYCVMLVFPYAVLSLTGLVLCSCESISMSEFMLRCISKNGKLSDYSFKKFYKSYLKYYIYIIASAVIKTMLEYLFVGLFVF